jgi:hypothetical protein
MRDPLTGEERMAEADWKPEFQERIAGVIGSALWMIILYMALGALAGILLGMLFGRGVCAVFEALGLFAGIQGMVPEFMDYLPYYYMLVTGVAGVVMGMGIGLRQGVISGNVAVSRAVLLPAIDAALKKTAGFVNAAPAGLADRLRAVSADELHATLRARVAVVEDHIEGFGVARLFRRYVAAITVDYIEQVTRLGTSKLAEGTNRLLYKDHLIRLRDAVMAWMRRRAARATILSVFTLVAMPVIGMSLMFFFPALSIFLA